MDQHFPDKKFIAYSGGGIQMNDEMRMALANSVVFDMDRRSIYAQTQEFGYVEDTTSEVDVRNAADDNISTLILNVNRGVVTLSEYISVTIASMKLTTNVSVNEISANTTLEAGATLEVTKARMSFKGSGPATLFWMTEHHNDGSNSSETYISPYANAAAVSNGSWPANKAGTAAEQLMPTATSLTMGVVGGTTDNYWNTHTSYTWYCTSHVADNRMIDKGTPNATKTITFTWLPREFVGDISSVGGALDAAEIAQHLQTLGHLETVLTTAQGSQVSGTQLVFSKIYKNVLSNDFAVATTTSSQISSVAAQHQHLFFAVPSIVAKGKGFGIDNGASRKLATCILGGSATEAFCAPVRMTYTTATGRTINYDVFVAQGHDWHGSTVFIQK